MSHPYLTDTRLRGLQYIVVPKALLTAAPRLGLDMDDAVMYCVLRSRCDLSLRNGWVDELGRVYITYTRPQMAAYLGWGKKKTIDAFRRLAEAGLIVEKDTATRHHGVTAKRIYVRMWCAPREEDMPVGLSPDDIRGGALPFLRRENIREMTGSYFVIPRLLLEHPSYAGLSLRAKLLYVITMDQLNLSLEFGQTETLPTGETVPYCYLDRPQLCKLLSCGDRTLTSAFQSLEQCGLMERKKVTFQSEMRVYLRDFLPESDDSEPIYLSGEDGDPLFSDPNAAKIEPQPRKNRTPIPQQSNPEAAKTAPTVPQQSNPSELRQVRTTSDPVRENLPRGREAAGREKRFSALLERLAPDQMEEDLMKLCPPARQSLARQALELSFSVLEEDFAFPGRKIRFGTEFLEIEEVLGEYERLDRWILLTMVLKIAEQPEVRQLRQYIHRSLLTAAEKHAGESYYTRLRLEKPSPSPADRPERRDIMRRVMQRRNIAAQADSKI